MNNTIIKSFDSWTSAQAIKSNGRVVSVDNQKPHGINKLRELILEMAVNGKLVPQDKNDEPASELIKKIVLEKKRLIDENIIKKEKLDLDVNDIKFNLPIGWKAVYMQDITSVITCGIASTPKYYDNGKIFLSAKNVKPYKFMPDDHQFVDDETYRKIVSWGAKPEFGDILLTRIGAGIGEAALVDQEIDFAYYVSLTLIKPIQPFINSKYLLNWINSPAGVNKALEGIYGKGVSQGNLNVNQVRKFIIPIPPLAEQHRIVAKVDELMAICDLLELQQTSSNIAHQKLVEVLLGTLTSTKSQTEFEEAWQRIANHFDTLFTTEFAVDDLKKTILQLAIMGKLTSNWRNSQVIGDSAEKLLKRIIERKRNKKEQSLSSLKREEMPYEIPENWVWCKLNDLNNPEYPFSYGVLKPGENDPNGVLLVMSQHINYNQVNQNINSRITKELDEQYKRTKIKGGEILLNLVGASIGRTAIAPNWLIGANVSRAVAVMTFVENVNTKFIQYTLNNFFSPENIKKHSSGSAQPVLNLGEIREFVISLPSYEEQSEVVSKVDELFALCDSLKAKIKESQNTQVQLAEAVVEGVVG